MTAAGDMRGLLAMWPAAAAEAVGPALDAAAEAVAAETRRALAGVGVPDDDQAAVVTGRDGEGRVTVTVPGAWAREFGTLRTAARPFLRPAVAAKRDDIRRRLAEAVRRALPQRGAR